MPIPCVSAAYASRIIPMIGPRGLHNTTSLLLGVVRAIRHIVIIRLVQVVAPH